MEIMLWYFTLNGLVFSGTLVWYAVTKYDIKKSGRENAIGMSIKFTHNLMIVSIAALIVGIILSI